MKIRNRGKITICLVILTVVILLVTLVELAWAETPIPYNRVIDCILGQGDFYDNLLVRENAVRVVMALLVGASLAACGCAMQAVFRNPLASPYLLGLSSGASLGAAVSILVAIPLIPLVVVTPLFAFIFCLLTMLIVYGVSKIGGHTNTETLILTGVAVSSMMTAFVSFLTYIAPDDKMGDIVFWSMGSLGSRTVFSESLMIIMVIAPIILVGTFILVSYGKYMNAMMLGDHHAMDLGIDVAKVRLTLLVTTTLMVAAAVAFVGAIGFVGLIIPHIFRIILGPDNRILIPMSAIGGATFLLTCDYLAHIILPVGILPVGILTAMVGAPYFIYLLRRRKHEVGWS